VRTHKGKVQYVELNYRRPWTLVKGNRYEERQYWGFLIIHTSMVLTYSQQKEATFKDGCLSLRKSVLDKMRAKSAPGPIYHPKARVSSTEKCLRDVTFGIGPAR
jgi:hypothetical protein